MEPREQQRHQPRVVAAPSEAAASLLSMLQVVAVEGVEACGEPNLLRKRRAVLGISSHFASQNPIVSTRRTASSAPEDAGSIGVFCPCRESPWWKVAVVTKAPLQRGASFNTSQRESGLLGEVWRRAAGCVRVRGFFELPPHLGLTGLCQRKMSIGTRNVCFLMLLMLAPGMLLPQGPLLHFLDSIDA